MQLYLARHLITGLVAVPLPAQWASLSVELIPDANKDGIREIAVGFPGSTPADGVRGCAWIVSGKDGTMLGRFDPPGHGVSFGAMLRSIGDIDKDAVADVAALDYESPLKSDKDTTPVQWRDLVPRLSILSGKTGAVVDVIRFCAVTAKPLADHVVDIGAIGDVDSDGIPDLLVGLDHGVTRVYSGRTRKLLRESTRYYTERVPSTLSMHTDINGDSLSDYIISQPWPADSSAGLLEVCSGQDDSCIVKVAVSRYSGEAPRYLAVPLDCYDIDKDGRPDVICGLSSGFGSVSGGVSVYSGKNGVPLFECQAAAPRASGDAWPVTMAGGKLGISAAGVPDTNEDDVGDILVGVPMCAVARKATNSLNDGLGDTSVVARVELLSGKDGSVLRSSVVDADNAQCGGYVALFDDVDGDGRPDYIVANRYVFDRDTDVSDRIHIVSSRSLESICVLSVTADGPVRITH